MRPSRGDYQKAVWEKLAKRFDYRFANRIPVAIRRLVHTRALFPGSSVVEQPAVNRLVAGSNPARGATCL